MSEQSVRDINAFLIQALPNLELTVDDNFWDSALWHARITGCAAEAGVKNGFKLETERRFITSKYSKQNDY